MPNQIEITEVLATLARQTRVIALALGNVCEPTEFTRSALRGGRDLLTTIASSLDDLTALPLPTLEELGDDESILQIAHTRTQNRKAQDLLDRIRSLGQFHKSTLTESLVVTLNSMTDLEQQLSDMETRNLDDSCLEIIQSVRQGCKLVAIKMEVNIAELRHLNDSVTSILTTLDEENSV